MNKIINFLKQKMCCITLFVSLLILGIGSSSCSHALYYDDPVYYHSVHSIYGPTYYHYVPGKPYPHYHRDYRPPKHPKNYQRYPSRNPRGRH